jgi:hypothetical protein
MQDRRKHILARQYVEVTYEGAADAFTFKRRLSEVCTTRLIPALEKLFDTIAPADVLWCYDKLVIDIGTLPETNWETALVEQVTARLAHDLAAGRSFHTASSSLAGDVKHYQAANPANPSSNDPLSSAAHPLQQQHSSSVRHGMSGENTEASMAWKDSDRREVLYFLETGRLPWNARITSHDELMYTLLRLTEDPAFREQLSQHFSAHDAILQRLLSQCTEPVLDSLLHAYVAGREVSEWINIFKALCASAMIEVQVPAVQQRQILYRVLFRVIASGKTPAQQQSFIQLCFHAIVESIAPNHHAAMLTAIQRYIDDSRAWCASVDISYQKANKFFKALREWLHSEGGLPSLTQTGDFYKEPRTIPGKQGVERNSESVVGKKQEVRADDASMPDDGEVVFIANSGLVILHPFLPALFENIGYTEEKVWLNTAVKQRAIVLMQYMATGQELYPEFDLLLNKILLGYDLPSTLPADIVLSDYEKAEAQQVLRSVINHWPALKNTSVEGLQVTFLQRAGRLTFSHQSWKLDVEHKTVDILMNKLAWSISIIKTPWMNAFMQVTWPS